MAQEPSAIPRVDFPPIPEAGLRECLSGWSGRGQLLDAILSVKDLISERAWSPRDVERRAHRVLLQRLSPRLALWPTNLAVWIEALPAESRKERRSDTFPFSGVAWSETRSLGTWPPTRFVGRARGRFADTVLVTTLKWTIEYLLRARKDAVAVWPDCDEIVRRQLDVAAKLLDHEPLASAEPVAPSPTETAALRYEGRPWHVVAPVAEELRAVEGSAAELALRLIAPDEEFRWRLFHLGALGTILVALKESGATVTSLRPLSGGSAGPSYSVLSQDGRVWDLWFEAGGAWAHYGVTCPYTVATKGVPGAGRPLGADIALLRCPGEGLLVECKYSWDPQVVARGGYEQALAYLAEAKTGLLQAAQVVVVGPEGVVTSASMATTYAGNVTIAPPAALQAIVESTIGK